MRRPFAIPSLAAAIGLVIPPALARAPAAAPNKAPATWFVCDGIAGPLAAIFGTRDAHGMSAVTLVDRAAGRTTRGSVAVGDGDAGAGQVHHPLSRGGRAVGDIHMVNPGMVGNPVLPAVSGVDLDGRHLDCRFMPDMRFLGIGLTRSVMVRGAGAGLLYESFDYKRRGTVTNPDGAHRSNVPSLAIRGGRETAGGFGFGNGGMFYTVDRARVVARQGRRIVASDAFAGSESASSDAMSAIGRAALWPAGASFAGCRGALPPADLRTCMIDAMEQGGATPAAVSFSSLLADRGDFGFMTGWRQAGPVGIATMTYPWRANSNTAQAILPRIGAPIFVDDYQSGPADTARGDWRAFAAAHPDAFPVTPAEVPAPRIVAGAPVTIRARYAMATCRACAVLGEMTVAWRFAADGRLLGAAVERVSGHRVAA